MHRRSDADATHDALVARLSSYDSLVEVGIGRRPGVAVALARRGRRVTAIDVHERPVPEGVGFVRDDVVAAARRPDPGPTYRVEAIYARHLPPELHRPTRTVARRVDADCLFTTLGGDAPAIPATPERVGSTTLFVALPDAP